MWVFGYGSLIYDGWKAFIMDEILGALEKNDIDPGTRGEVTAILYSLKGQIIRV